MTLQECFQSRETLLMEGALGVRLKREFGLLPDANVALARHAESDAGRAALSALWRGYAAVARDAGLPFLASTPTRRLNRERAERGGADASLLARNLAFLRETLRGMTTDESATAPPPSFAGALIGCRGDAYTGVGALDRRAARAFHAWETQALRDAGADFLFAALMPTLPEAIGMAEAMSDAGLPALLGFTVRRDGCLIDGTPIHDAIGAVDDAVARPPVCYLACCVHPSIVHDALSAPFNRTARVRERFSGIQGNTSALPYAALDDSDALHASPPEVWARDMLRLRRDFGLKIVGGCCGTDDRHMAALAQLLQSAG